MKLINQDKIINDVICRRYEIVQARLNDKLSVKSILRKYNLSRPTFYTYLNRFLEHGIFGLRDISRAPKHNANKTPKEKEEGFIKLHNKYPYLSSYELSEICGLGYKSIQRIRKENNLEKVYKPKSQKKTLLKNLKKRYQKIRKENKETRLVKKKNSKLRT